MQYIYGSVFRKSLEHNVVQARSAKLKINTKLCGKIPICSKIAVKKLASLLRRTNHHTYEHKGRGTKISEHFCRPTDEMGVNRFVHNVMMLCRHRRTKRIFSAGGIYSIYRINRRPKRPCAKLCGDAISPLCVRVKNPFEVLRIFFFGDDARRAADASHFCTFTERFSLNFCTHHVQRTSGYRFV